MPTATKQKKRCFSGIEAVKYPYDFVAELETDAEIARLKYRAGELKSISAEDFALKFGVDSNDSKI